MSQAAPTRNQFEHLKRPPGPRGWQNRAARELGYSRGYISKVVRKLVRSTAAEAALEAWKNKNEIQ